VTQQEANETCGGMVYAEGGSEADGRSGHDAAATVTNTGSRLCDRSGGRLRTERREYGRLTATDLE
jgi:hypothetical protein